VAHSLSAKKRIRQNAKRRMINRARKNEVRTAIKKFEKLTTQSADPAGLETQLRLTQKRIDQLVAMGNLHKNTAARKKSQLTRKLNAIKPKAGA